MEKIVDKIYDEELKERDGFFGKINSKQTSKEWQIYDELYEALSGRDKEKFCEYLRIINERHTMEMREAYKQGFKTGIAMIMESIRH